ncbi:MAG: hypothetical protein ACHBNF_01035 [Chromatiales bacterium]
MTIKEAERRLILSTLVSAKTLYNRLRQYGASSSLSQSPFLSKVKRMTFTQINTVILAVAAVILSVISLTARAAPDSLPEVRRRPGHP